MIQHIDLNQTLMKLVLNQVCKRLSKSDLGPRTLWRDPVTGFVFSERSLPMHIRQKMAEAGFQKSTGGKSIWLELL